MHSQHKGEVVGALLLFFETGVFAISERIADSHSNTSLGKFGLLGNHENEIVTACRGGRGVAHFVLQDYSTTMQHVFSGGLRCKSGSPVASSVSR